MDILIPNDIDISSTSISVRSIDESFQKLKLKICELNEPLNYELALFCQKMDSFSECLNKFVNNSQPSQQGKSLEVNISPLKKNLCMKDKKIKKLVETKSTVLDTLSAKSNSQHSNTLNQSSIFLPSNIPNENSDNTKQLASHKQQHPPIALSVLHNCNKYRIPFKHTTQDPIEILQ